MKFPDMDDFIILKILNDRDEAVSRPQDKACAPMIKDASPVVDCFQ